MHEQHASFYRRGAAQPSFAAARANYDPLCGSAISRGPEPAFGLNRRGMLDQRICFSTQKECQKLRRKQD